jgi:3-hydroxy-D-aspartate aldolase
MSQHGQLAVLDAGLKSMTLESGLPVVSNLSDCRVLQCNDEHSMVEDSNSVLRINDRVRLIPGHCDPTCNLHDCYVGVRNGVVEAIWPVSARGRSL